MMGNSQWYEKMIEPEIRELVYILRNYGFNTVASCGHQMYVQIELVPDYFLKEMHDIVFNWLAKSKKQALMNYSIDIHHEVANGVLMQSFAEIRILPETEAKNDN